MKADVIIALSQQLTLRKLLQCAQCCFWGLNSTVRLWLLAPLHEDWRGCSCVYPSPRRSLARAARAVGRILVLLCLSFQIPEVFFPRCWYSCNSQISLLMNFCVLSNGVLYTQPFRSQTTDLHLQIAQTSPWQGNPTFSWRLTDSPCQRNISLLYTHNVVLL